MLSTLLQPLNERVANTDPVLKFDSDYAARIQEGDIEIGGTPKLLRKRIAYRSILKVQISDEDGITKYLGNLDLDILDKEIRHDFAVVVVTNKGAPFFEGKEPRRFRISKNDRGQHVVIYRP